MGWRDCLFWAVCLQYICWKLPRMNARRKCPRHFCPAIAELSCLLDCTLVRYILLPRSVEASNNLGSASESPGGLPISGNLNKGKSQETMKAPELRDAENIVRTNSRTNSQSVAVVGGSAAGLFTASLLARQGVSVSVFGG